MDAGTTAVATATDAQKVADAIAAAMVAHDHPALMALYADDVVFRSPVTAVEFASKTDVGTLMTHVMEGFETWRRTFVLAGDDEAVFGAQGRIAGREVELAERIRLGSDGLVHEVSIYGRPLAGVAAIAAVAAPRLAARHGRIRALLVRAMSGRLPGALANGDRVITRLVR